jgi:3-deoxy-D-manno-octulosonate 8-phosphate phosphatase (KDO 8-P phosphatase)
MVMLVQGQPAYHETILIAASKIRLIALDVDGVMTNGQIAYTSSGEEIKAFNAKDGQGLVMAVKAGIATAIITARQSNIVERRAMELAIAHVYQGCKRKADAFAELLDTLKLTPECVAYMGDDLPDLAILNQVGLAACPVDAVKEVQDVCLLISQHPGGGGAVRQLCDLILYTQKRHPLLK